MIRQIFVSAGEASSDIHCAHLLREYRALGHSFQACGIGGDSLAAEGVELLLHNRELSVGGGVFEVISKLPLRHKIERRVENLLFSGKKLDCAILVDSGEINLRLASLFHFFHVPVVYFIPPKVWVWRHSRIEDLERHADLVLGILPFEEPIYRSWEIPFKYVGNPLIDEVDQGLTEQGAKTTLGIPADRPVVTVLVGSRHTEVKHHLEPFSQAIRILAGGLNEKEQKPLILLPAAQAVDSVLLKQAFEAALAGSGCEIKVVQGQSHLCLKAARVALVKSGTSTLEAGLLGVPMVLAYQSSRSAAWVYRHIVRYRGYVGLVNLFLARSAENALGFEPHRLPPVVPELILSDCIPERIARELLALYRDGEPRQRMLEELSRIRGLLAPPEGSNGSPLRIAARSLAEVVGEGASGVA